ncbi:hypothetical protein [Halobacteriovorax sp. JY17]|uniref:hypothetical protein n=1 Tax=Halobacteriovorax sp. JY17 TaxID=2014617 RepID=UPI000C538894|nr:hypothetical protein [Halobacteriovorax sp. JY17]PIK15201.1 MAG: hypothetical protein CES88_00380 [Halobacteriovorax sp. JY17]
MKKIILCAVLLTLNFNLLARDIKIPQAQCSDIDVRDKMNDEMQEHFSKPQNQDGVGWCYAFAAADLMTAEAKTPISSTHVSAIFNKKIDKNIFLKTGYKIGQLFSDGAFDTAYEGGWIDRAVKNTSSEKFVCSEEDLPFDENRRGETAMIVKRLESIKSRLKEDNISNSCLEITLLRNDSFKNMNINEIYLILESDNINRAFSDLISQNCKKDLIKVEKYKVKSLSRPNYSRRHRQSSSSAKRDFTKKLGRHFDTIGKVLSSGKPMGVSYNVNNITSSSGGHASVLVGRRWKNGKCQFKIRNSWGKSCGGYDRTKIEECNYEEGAYWVSDQKFYDMVSSIDYISN